MARGRKAFVLSADVLAMLETGKDTVERKSDNQKVPYTFPAIPETGDEREAIANAVFQDMDIDTRISILNAKLKSTPRNAAANGVDDNTRRADELMAVIKKGGDAGKAAKKELAALLASME